MIGIAIGTMIGMPLVEPVKTYLLPALGQYAAHAAGLAIAGLSAGLVGLLVIRVAIALGLVYD